MQRFDFRYPGDPPATFVEMTRTEFLRRHPRAPFVITDLTTGEREELPMGLDEIACDLCSIDPGDTVYVLYYGRGGCRGYCGQCFHSRHARYCTPKENQEKV